MTKEEIEAYNNQFMRVQTLLSKPFEDCGHMSEAEDLRKEIKRIEGLMRSRLDQAIWNAALDKAAMACYAAFENRAAARIRELKK